MKAQGESVGGRFVWYIWEGIYNHFWGKLVLFICLTDERVLVLLLRLMLIR